MSRVSEWEIERVWEWESVWEWERQSVRVTFEHRDENKSCSACQEWFNERLSVRVRKSETVRKWERERVRMRVSNIGKRLKTLKNVPGSQLLSDVQTFFISCGSSKVIVCHAVTFHMSHVICQMLMFILGTSWTTFALMSMIKSPPYHPLLWHQSL